jgi:hypothetical protein
MAECGCGGCEATDGVYGKTPQKTVAEMPTKRGILSAGFCVRFKG